MLVLARVRGGHDGQLRTREPQVIGRTRLDERHQRERLDRRPEGDRDLRVTDGAVDLTRCRDLDDMAPMPALDDGPAVHLDEHGRGHVPGVARCAGCGLAGGARRRDAGSVWARRDGTAPSRAPRL